MSSNVGLSTPRGSGTSGYVQRNLSLLIPRSHPYSSSAPGSAPSQSDPYGLDTPRHKPRKPDQAILTHDRLREIEAKVFELRDQLEEEGDVEEEEIERREEELRAKLMMEMEEGGKGGGRERPRFKLHQVHEQAEEKERESERLRRALGIREDYQEGGHWRRGEERMRESVQQGGEEKARR